VLHEVKEIGLEELGPSLIVGLELLKQVQENIEANVRHVPHGVLERPHDRIHEDLELGGGDLEVRWQEKNTTNEKFSDWSHMITAVGDQQEEGKLGKDICTETKWEGRGYEDKLKREHFT